ncbi:ATS1 protein [Plectosphaerella plurivora]|uniref:ATS1 protein n=1 Tax=Plectosphaerella plurivora TaxID=936078 RepID=A0A9P8VHZ9_9PEZI|nr:ATS1 protein [Plectosphaerella plurivora]
MSVTFTLGSNGSGQLGISHKEDVSVPKQALFHPSDPSSPVAKVAAGGNHTLLLTQDGQLFWSGDAVTGACGLTADALTTEPVFQPVRIARDDPSSGTSDVLLIAASWEASYVVRKDSHGKATRLFSFGSGAKGELGHGESLVRSPSGTEFKDFPPSGTEVVDLAACMSHAVVVLSDGSVYSWGNGRKGEAGEPAAVLFTPRKIEGIDFKVVRAVCGREFTCLFGEPDEGRLSVLGSDKWEICSSAPTSISGWKDVGAGWGAVYVLKEDGSLMCWGRDDHGQLAPPSVPKLSKIAIGSEHTLGLTETGDVLAWGWGEHGNCGPQVENNDVKGRWNTIASSKFLPPDAKITGIGAGCATSWVFIHMG